jgi:hypothetical protein
MTSRESGSANCLLPPSLDIWVETDKIRVAFTTIEE